MQETTVENADLSKNRMPMMGKGRWANRYYIKDMKPNDKGTKKAKQDKYKRTEKKKQG